MKKTRVESGAHAPSSIDAASGETPPAIPSPSALSDVGGLSSLIDLLSKLGSIAIDGQAMRDRDFLERNGWICLGAEVNSGQVHWTTLERGTGEGGPVTFQRAIWLQKTKDATARNAALAKARGETDA